RVDPGRDGRQAAIRRQGPPDSHENILGKVLGESPVAENGIGEAHHFAAEVLHDQIECRSVEFLVKACPDLRMIPSLEIRHPLFSDAPDCIESFSRSLKLWRLRFESNESGVEKNARTNLHFSWGRGAVCLRTIPAVSAARAATQRADGCH